MTRPRTTVRDATAQDAAACARIYAQFVTDTVVSFEARPPTTAQMRRRIEDALRTHAWVVLTDGDQVVGYAYGCPFKNREAYRWSCEVSVYVEPGRHRTGAGRALYGALFERLAARGYRTAVTGMTLPNEASVGVHRAMGFVAVGTYRHIGWKHGAWRDVAWMQRPLGLDDDDPPAEPR